MVLSAVGLMLYCESYPNLTSIPVAVIHLTLGLLHACVSARCRCHFSFLGFVTPEHAQYTVGVVGEFSCSLEGRRQGCGRLADRILLVTQL